MNRGVATAGGDWTEARLAPPRNPTAPSTIAILTALGLHVACLAVTGVLVRMQVPSANNGTVMELVLAAPEVAPDPPSAMEEPESRAPESKLALTVPDPDPPSLVDTSDVLPPVAVLEAEPPPVEPQDVPKPADPASAPRPSPMVEVKSPPITVRKTVTAERPRPVVAAWPPAPRAVPGMPPATLVSGPVTPGPVAAAAPAARSVADGPPADLEAALSARIRAAVQAAVHYPAAARMMGITGRARVMLTYRDGAVGGPALAQSSGVAQLDEAALAATRTAHYPPPPPAVAGQALRFLVWVEFGAS
jgi:protein TonB